MLAVTSCRAVYTNEVAGIDNKQNHRFEIMFVNSVSNYSAILNAIHQGGFSPEIQHEQVAGNYQNFSVLSFCCDNVPESFLARFKHAISSCSGVLILYDSILE